MSKAIPSQPKPNAPEVTSEQPPETAESMLNDEQKAQVAALAAAAAALADEAAAAVAATPAAEEEALPVKVKKEDVFGKKVWLVTATGADSLHLLTNETLGCKPTKVLVDDFAWAQIEAGKWVPAVDD